MAQKHILVIDDDVTSLDLVSFLFEEKGFKVDRLADGFSAIEHVRTSEPDIIVIDLMMPGINGVETVKQIRALGLKQVPIIAFTAVDDPVLHSEALSAGCNKVLTKPIRPDKLVKGVTECLGPCA